MDRLAGDPSARDVAVLAAQQSVLGQQPDQDAGVIHMRGAFDNRRRHIERMSSLRPVGELRASAITSARGAKLPRSVSA